jgi:hypothetical protein
MTPIKIECACGQRYAFDAEPVDGQLTGPVNCPACGADGTAAANEILEQTLTPQPARAGRATDLFPASTLATPMRPANAMSASALHASRLGMVDRAQAEIEARAKVSWGDPPEAVLQYLMIQRFSHAEATEFLAVLFRERSAAVRARGLKKILIGCGMIVAAAAGMLYMLAIKLLMAKIVGLLFALACWGLWNLINGIIMVVAPKMQSGDVAES